MTDEVDHRGYSTRQVQPLARVEAEVGRIGGGSLKQDTFVIEGHDRAGDLVRVYVARIEAVGQTGEAETYRGASFDSPARALRQALRGYRAAYPETTGGG